MYRLYPASIVPIGNTILGGLTEVRKQSMTNTPTTDEKQTYYQIKRLVEVGTQLVRISVRNKNDLRSFWQIKQTLRINRIFVPLIADVHFSSNLSYEAAKVADKVRINPGNFLPRNLSSYSTKDLSDILKPLTILCKKNQTAIRIGTNKGSISPKFANKYGRGAEALAYSTLEFIEAFLMHKFDRLVLSVKASDVSETIEATMLLLQLQRDLGVMFPLHIGITEAGFGFWGRVKSAVGVGILLAHGIGDTVRISLTEPPENEIEVINILTKLIKPTKQDLLVLQKFISYRNKLFVPNIYVSLPKLSQIPIMHQADGYDIVKTNEYLIIEWNKYKSLYQILQEIINADDTRFVALKIKADVGEEFMYALSVNLGFMLYYGQISACIIDGNDSTTVGFAYQVVLEVLQSLGKRRIHPEFVSCPSCSRTSFDIIELSQKIMHALLDYRNLKIAVMGCIVNGPGEMGDADYGVIGMGYNKLAIYKKKNCIEKNVPIDIIVDRLKQIISEDQAKKNFN